ncbi:MAG: glycoside hydrolase family 15 protein, partial [Firmicutes bacterium]|nr:glycoside hydrolase family 15 protein [Bacillota bacterium]
MEKYFNDAVIGNKNLKASYTSKGELIRLFYPDSVCRQYIDYLRAGVKVNDSNLIYLHDDVNNTYKQYYTEDTNILNTEILNTYFNLKIIQTDFVSIKKNILIKKYKFINKSHLNLDLSFIIHSKLLTNENDRVGGYYKYGSLIQYSRSGCFCIFSKNNPQNFQINNTAENIIEGNIGGKDYVGLSSDSSISYSIGVLNPGEEKELDIFVYVGAGPVSAQKNMDEICKEIDELKKTNVKEELGNTAKYWEKYVKNHSGINLELADTPKNRRLQEIYKRTILLYPLLANHETGGIAAAVEIDEGYSKSGGYGYCWTRDAEFITEAMDILKMEKETEKFYKTFCKNTQNKDGMWEQRFYTDGALAPCWGYQIDETASVIRGTYNHFVKTKDKKFLKDNLKMCEKGIKFLEGYIDNITSCYDLWEMYEGIHMYSIASVFAAFEAMLKTYKELDGEFAGNRLKQEGINKQKEILGNKIIEIKKYVLNNFYDESKKSFVRNL